MNPSPPVAPAKSRWLSKKARNVYLPCLMLLLPVVVIGGYRLFVLLRDYDELRRAVAEIEKTEAGWRMADLEAQRADVPDEENGALCVEAANESLPRPLANSPEWNDVENVGLRTRFTAKQLQMLRNEMKRDAAAVTEARKLADLPRGRFHVAWTRTLLDREPPHVALPRDLVWLLHGDVLLRTAEGDYDGALLSCRAAWNAGRSFGDEPYMAAQSSRLSCRSSALLSMERVLAQGQPSPSALKPLLAALLDEDRQPLVLIGWRGERAALYDLMEAHRDGEISNASSMELSRRDVAAKTMQVLTRMIEIIKESPPMEQTPQIRELALSLKGSAGDKPSLPCVAAQSYLMSLHSFRLKFLRQQAMLRSAAVALAAEIHRQTHHGRWPERLEELAPDLLAEVPLDPFDGRPLRYHIQKESIIVYSVGVDGVDDGGKIDDPSPFEITDIGIRLWNVEQRGLPPA
jgi:hypothetical protein